MSESEKTQAVGVTHFPPDEEKQRQERVMESVASKESDEDRAGEDVTALEDTQKSPNRS